jgi:hypothetical protein
LIVFIGIERDEFQLKQLIFDRLIFYAFIIY